MNLPERICHHQHPAEWDSPTPRTKACEDCVQFAVAIGPINNGIQMTIERVLPPQEVVVVCVNCGGSARRRA